MFAENVANPTQKLNLIRAVSAKLVALSLSESTRQIGHLKPLKKKLKKPSDLDERLKVSGRELKILMNMK